MKAFMPGDRVAVLVNGGPDVAPGIVVELDMKRVHPPMVRRVVVLVRLGEELFETTSMMPGHVVYPLPDTYIPWHDAGIWQELEAEWRKE